MLKIRKLTVMILVFALIAGCFGTAAFAAENEYSYDTRYAGFMGRGLIHEERFADRDLHYGIDVSSHQNEIDWKAVADAGCEFVFVRVGYRGYETGKIVEDKYAEVNICGALKNGLMVGVYLFSQAITVEEGIEEADFVVDLIDRYGLGPANILLPVVYDVEFPSENGQYVGRLYDAKLDRRTSTDIAKAFMDRIEEAGYVPCFYGSRSAFNNNSKGFMDEINGRYAIWLAAYTQSKKSGYEGPYDFWQYSSFGKVPGVEGETDLDVWYLDPDAQTGWVLRDGAVRYLPYKNGSYLTGWQTIGGDTYYFSKEGAMLTGWQTLDGKYCYLGQSGKLRTGWEEIDGARYYFGDDGDRRTGWQDIEGERYWFGDDGAMRTGLQKIEEERYWFSPEGAMYTGWQYLNKEFYWFREDGTMVTGKQKVDDLPYTFSDDGVLQWGLVRLYPGKKDEGRRPTTVLVTPGAKIRITK